MCTIQPSDVKKVKPSPPLYTDKSKAKVKQSKRFVFCHPRSLSPVIIYISNSLPHSPRTHLIYASFYAPYWNHFITKSFLLALRKPILNKAI
jgi:hypothetical protein